MLGIERLWQLVGRRLMPLWTSTLKTPCVEIEKPC